MKICEDRNLKVEESKRVTAEDRNEKGRKWTQPA